jgi:hypothetical protein
VFPSYDSLHSFKIGAGQFANWHPLTTDSAVLRTGFGLSFGLGMTPASKNNTLGTAIMAGISVYRDSFLFGVGRNLGSNENFAYFGLRILPSFLSH